MTIFEGHPEEKEGDQKELALAKTCRQIRFESLPVLAKIGHSLSLRADFCSLLGSAGDTASASFLRKRQRASSLEKCSHIEEPNPHTCATCTGTIHSRLSPAASWSVLWRRTYPSRRRPFRLSLAAPHLFTCPYRQAWGSDG